MSGDGGVGVRFSAAVSGSGVRTRLALLSLGTAALVAVLVMPAPVSADINTAKTQVAQLEQRIASDGAAVERAVAAYDEAQAHAQQIQAKLDEAKAKVATDQQQQSKDMTTLRGVALAAYMSSSNENSSLSVFQIGSATSLAERQEYSRLATTQVRDAVDAVTIDEQQTQAAEVALQTQQTAAQAALSAAGAAKALADETLAVDDHLLGQADANLHTVEAAVAAQQEREREQEAAMAAAAAHPANFSFNPSPGSYSNPLRAINDLNPSRVDQGVDYQGYGPIFAVGDGVVLSTYNSGWPGGTFISYRLTDGPAGGLVAFAAEDIEPTVSVGQSVTAGTVLGNMYEGPDGIETGWADPSGDGETMARDAGQFNGSNSTAYGANFSQLLASLGAPPGVMQNEPPTGSLPPNWPTW